MTHLKFCFPDHRLNADIFMAFSNPPIDLPFEILVGIITLVEVDCSAQ